ncbi:hypothetical protein [Feifania hominis]|uniref:Uncharacterized protein n=1 Tax=Feifania hominis TaxID=2763660 RepID=A0A926DE14_9FIRM|nr:hypothetical protein [Feifania hominis]MBC8537235.1 hypothetical protein [Feifania hominis]
MDETVSANSQEAAVPETNSTIDNAAQQTESKPDGQAEGGNETAQDSTVQPFEGEQQRDLERDAAFAHLRREMEAARREARRLRSAGEENGRRGQSAQWEAMRQENDFLRDQVFSRFYSDDLEIIRAAHPDCRAESVNDLGLDFCGLRAMGVDPLVAYEAMQSAHSATQRQKPPTMGSAKSTGKTESGFYTREDVRRMSQDDVSRNFDKIRKSMSKWR